MRGGLASNAGAGLFASSRYYGEGVYDIGFRIISGCF
jgi:hypothetical protein